MAALATQSVESTGSTITFASAAGGGDTCAAGDDKLLFVRNADASDKTVTLTTPGTVDGLAIADRAITVTAGTTKAVRLLKSLYGNADGQVAIAYSAVTSVTVAVVQGA